MCTLASASLGAAVSSVEFVVTSKQPREQPREQQFTPQCHHVACIHRIACSCQGFQVFDGSTWLGPTVMANSAHGNHVHCHKQECMKWPYTIGQGSPTMSYLFVRLLKYVIPFLPMRTILPSRPSFFSSACLTSACMIHLQLFQTMSYAHSSTS